MTIPILLPSPQELGLPAKYKAWRPNQDVAIVEGLKSKKRVVVQVQRTGSGKTCTIMVQTILSEDKRCVILTASKGLQDQYADEWQEYGLVDLRGKGSYSCDGITDATCDDGALSKCAFAGSSACSYTAALQAAREARVVVTNYACWIALNKYGQGLGHVDVLMCDEAHNAPAEIAKAMRIQISARECEMMKRDWPDDANRFDMTVWKHWAHVSFLIVENEIERLKKVMDKHSRPDSKLVTEYKHFRNLSRKLADLATCKAENWICDEWTYGYQFDPIQPEDYAERILFRNIERIYMTSGTVRPKTIRMCGFKEEDVDYFDYPSPVAKHRSPFIHIKTGIEVKYGMPEAKKLKLVQWIDRIIESRLDRKGIIHTANFELRDFIKEHSEWGSFMETNYKDSGETTMDVIHRFKAMLPPAVLISPSVTTGYDFPYDACRYQIIAKLPFPNQTSKIEIARRKLDQNRGAYHMMQSLAQAFGRGDRAEDDYQEVFVLDALMPWAKRRWGKLAPVWLWHYYTESNTIPPPIDLDELSERGGLKRHERH